MGNLGTFQGLDTKGMYVYIKLLELNEAVSLNIQLFTNSLHKTALTTMLVSAALHATVH